MAGETVDKQNIFENFNMSHPIVL